MTTTALTVDAKDVVKRFKGAVGGPALNGITLSIPKGQLTALVGPDGAGKTTLIRLIAGLMKPDSGSLYTLGIDVAAKPQEVQDLISYMPQRFGLYEDLSVMENLNLYADLHGVPMDERRERFDRMLSMTDMAAFTNRLAGNLSGGMKQKLGLACTLVSGCRMAGRPIDIDVILSSARWLAGRYRSLVVEGAGGLCVPLDDKGHTMLDLISALDLPVILVGHAGLGAINHALLSLTALHQNGCRVLGVVLNDTVPIEAEQAYIHDDNALVIARLGRAQVLRVPYLGPQQERASNMAQLDALLDGTHFLKEALQ